jgi:mannose-6-phosphate isomerase-like protein (cupin superfamily)
MKKVNVSEKLAAFKEHWSPKIVGELNGQHVKLAKLQGEFVWHFHEHEDELFLIVRGELEMDWRDESGEHSVVLGEGEFLIVPRGVEHRPRATEETHLMLFEPVSTLHTGNVRSDRTVDSPEWI